MNTTPLEHRNTAHGILEAILDDLAIAITATRDAGLPHMAGNLDGNRADLERWAELLSLTPDEREQLRLTRNTRGQERTAASIKQHLDTYCQCPGPHCPIHGDIPA